MSLRCIPLNLAQANDKIREWHRHHKPVTGHRFSLGAVSEGEIVGVCCVGRPVGREVDQDNICEINRLATNGHRNACSFLYAKSTRVAREMGFSEIRTYILQSEPGTSLLALKQLGWINDGVVRRDGKGWSSRDNRVETEEPKQRWRCRLNESVVLNSSYDYLDLIQELG